MSTFDARSGTRGARQPNGRIVLWINGFVAKRLRKGSKTPGFGFDMLLLTTTGRTSTAPPMRAAGIRAASSIAASRSSVSKKRYPPSASLTATNGPSVGSVLPSSTRTVVAISGACIWTPGLTPGVWLIAW